MIFAIDYASPSVFESDRERALVGMSANARRPVRFHDLRHTAAAWLIKSGASLKHVADLLGHSDVRVTQRYAHLAVADLRRAVARMPQSRRRKRRVAA